MNAPLPTVASTVAPQSERHAPGLHIGVDLDNTLIDYERVFIDAARAQGLIDEAFTGTRLALREQVRAGSQGELRWQRLQAEVYAGRILQARLYPGVRDFLAACVRHGIDVVVISHKTRHAAQDRQRRDLRALAFDWLERQGLFEPRYGLRRDQIHFTDSRTAKLQLISQLGCTHFVDDLREVIDAADLSDRVTGLLFDPHAQGDTGCVRHWDELHELLPSDAAEDADRVMASQLLGRAPRTMVRVSGGGNNRLYRIADDAGRRFALKHYANDGRQRLQREVTALRLMNAAGLRGIPRLHAVDASGYALSDWLPGEPTGIVGAPQVGRLTGLLDELHRLRAHPQASALPLASDACLAPRDLVDQLLRRRTRLDQVTAQHALQTFLGSALDPAMRRLVGTFQHRTADAAVPLDSRLARQYRTLNPADLGFHNTVASADGDIGFVDFEYFGWDDPVKAIADLLLHPRGIPAAHRGSFVATVMQIYAGDKDLGPRLHRSLPLFGLVWCLILLNEFLPDVAQRRTHAGRMDPRRHAETRDRQLHKAEMLLHRLPTLAEEMLP